MLQSRDIRNLRNQLKKRTFGGGYDVAEVDQHLTNLAERWEDASEQLHAAQEKVTELEEKLKHYEKVELALQEALETARDTARRTEESADRKARLIIEEAELRAQRIIQEAENERYGLRQDLTHLTNRQNEVAARLRSFLMSELEMLAQFQGEDPVGFIKLVAPERSAGERTLPKSATPIGGPPAGDDDLDEMLEESGGTKAEAEPAPDPAPPAPPASDPLVPTASGAGEDAEESTTADSPSPHRRVIPRSPWPDVDPPRVPPSTWAPASDAADADDREEVSSAPAEAPAPPLSAPPRDESAPKEAEEKPQPPAAPSWSSPGSFSSSPSPEPQKESGGWSLRSLVTGSDDESPEAKDKHHEAVRRIMEDMD